MVYCKRCDEGDAPAVLDEDGVLSSISGKPGCWSHAYEDNWWPCPRKAAELRALEVLVIEWVRAEAAMVDAIRAEGEGPIPEDSPADKACFAWEQRDQGFRAVCQELLKEAECVLKQNEEEFDESS